MPKIMCCRCYRRNCRIQDGISSQLSEGVCRCAWSRQKAMEFIAAGLRDTYGQQCMTDTFDRDFKFDVAHISITRRRQITCRCSNCLKFIAKASYEWLTILPTTFLAANCTKLVITCYGHTRMFLNLSLRAISLWSLLKGRNPECGHRKRC